MIRRRAPDVLDAGAVERLRKASPTAARPAVGLPAGHHRIHRSAEIGSGSATFAAAAAAVLTWQVQLGSGVRVRAESPDVREGDVAVVGLGVGPIRVGGPVRVLTVWNGPDRAGFTYATLPGHPESGEESFVVTRGADDVVTLEVSGFSRPAWRLARLASPVVDVIQRRVTDRYIRALDHQL